MKPIKEYDLVNEAGEFRRLPAGIYGVKITEVIDNPEKEYLEIYCDITKGEYANYFKTLRESGLRDTSRSCRSYKTSALPFFKAFITAVEKTNANYQWNWDEKTLVGKNVIAVFGEEEYLDKENNVKIATTLVEFRSLEAYQAGRIKVPELKKLPESELPQTQSVTLEAVNIDDLPF